MVCKLKKSLYGLKQASRQWFARLHSELVHLGFKQSKQDYSLFTKSSNDLLTIVAIYVDDILVTGNDISSITNLKSHLHSTFSIKDLGIINFFLGIEVNHLPNGIALTQRKFAQELLRDSGISVFKGAVTPLPLNSKLHKDSTPPFSDPTLYRSLVGKLNFLTHTLDQGILLKATDSITLQAFSDSDWAACLDTRRSVTGYLLLLGHSPVSWRSKKQGTVSKSSSEAEYRAMSAAASEITWIVRLLEDLGIHNIKPVTLHCDNQSALHIAHNPVLHDRTKHIEVDCHFTREKVMEGLIQLTYLPTSSQLADVLTKILPSHHFNELLSKLGMFDTLPCLRGVLKYTMNRLSN
ncbi:unnamed protein product [Amaranthus hypochondriacus]